MMNSSIEHMGLNSLNSVPYTVMTDYQQMFDAIGQEQLLPSQIQPVKK
jgi:hypothetical protein